MKYNDYKGPKHQEKKNEQKHLPKQGEKKEHLPEEEGDEDRDCCA